MSAADDDDPFDLDFTKVAVAPAVASPQVQPVPPPPPAAPPAPHVPLSLEPLDFAPRAAAPPVVAAAPAATVPVVAPAPALVGSVPQRLATVARMYAEGQAAHACSQLEGVLHREEFGECRELAWGMMFDLYQALGRHDAFDTLAIEFAGKFEKSPPTWAEPAEHAPAVGHDGMATVTLSGALGSNAVNPLKKLREMAGKVEGVRLDLGKVFDADDIGCGALLETLRYFKALKKTCLLVGGEKVVETLAPKVEMGEREHEATWLLLLELYQNLNRPDAFDEAAVGYAVTFEVSPPSFEVPKTPAPVLKKSPAAAQPPRPAEGFALSGELIGAKREHFSPLLTYASSHDPVIIDCSGLKRMDAACAAEFAKVVGELKEFGRGMRIRAANCLLIALWRSIGLERIAQIESRKF